MEVEKESAKRRAEEISSRAQSRSHVSTSQISDTIYHTTHAARTNTTMSADGPPETSVLFARGVIARLAYWPALRIAVEQGWGGPASAQKRTWLASVLVDEFEGAAGAAPDAEYVEELLLQAVADEFEAVLEDGSAAAVAGAAAST